MTESERLPKVEAILTEIQMSQLNDYLDFKNDEREHNAKGGKYAKMKKVDVILLGIKKILEEDGFEFSDDRPQRGGWRGQNK